MEHKKRCYKAIYLYMYHSTTSTTKKSGSFRKNFLCAIRVAHTFFLYIVQKIVEHVELWNIALKMASGRQKTCSTNVPQCLNLCSTMWNTQNFCCHYLSFEVRHNRNFVEHFLPFAHVSILRSLVFGYYFLFDDGKVYKKFKNS